MAKNASEPYFNETDEFFEAEMTYRDRGDWEELLSLYERELGHIEDEEKANDLRAHIESARQKVYADANEAEY